MSGSLAVGTATPDGSAAVTISSTTQGFLPPRMTTTQKSAISSPALGLMVYDSNESQVQYYNSSATPTWCGFSQGYVFSPNLANLSGFSSYVSNNLFWMRVGNFVSVTWRFLVINNNGSNTMLFTCGVPISQSTYNDAVFSGSVQIFGPNYPNHNGQKPDGSVLGYDQNNFQVYLNSGGYNNGASYNYNLCMSYIVN